MSSKRKSNQKKLELQILKLKRGGMFFLGFAFFLMPGQNYYSTAQLNYQPVQTRPIVFSLPDPAAYPINVTGVKPPKLTAQAVLVLDSNSAVSLFAVNEKTHLLPASTVKMMTALVTLDYYRLDDILTINQINNFGQDMELVEGERITVRNLLYGLLVYSANDAAWVLAQNYPGGQAEFVKAMNQKAKDFHLDNTYFANPAGINSDEKGRFLTDFSYTTALDLARLSVKALENPVFGEMVATQKITVTDVTGKFNHQLFNLNELLGKVKGLKGIKTGWTEDAEGCLVAYVERNGKGIIAVVLGSTDRFGETKKLVNWVFENFRWEDLAFTVPTI